MKAIVMRAFGGPEVLAMDDVPVRPPLAGEVLVKVSAVSVGRLLDVAARAGQLPWARIAPPHVLGAEHVGVVQRLGDGVTSFAVGDRVAVFPIVADGTCDMCLSGREEACPNLEIIGVHRPGAYAMYTTVPVRQLHRLPDEIDDAEACALALAGPVARKQLDLAGAGPESWVLVQAAGSALGACVAMLAKFSGSKVIGTTRHEEKKAGLARLGLDSVLNWTDTDFADQVRELTGGRGASIVVDNIGGADLFSSSMAALAAGGTLISSGAFAGGMVSLDLQRLYLLNQRIIGVRTADMRSVQRLWADVARGFRTAVDATFPMYEVAQAHRYVEQQNNIGRVVLTATWSPPVAPVAGGAAESTPGTVDGSTPGTVDGSTATPALSATPRAAAATPVDGDS